MTTATKKLLASRIISSNKKEDLLISEIVPKKCHCFPLFYILYIYGEGKWTGIGYIKLGHSQSIHCDEPRLNQIQAPLQSRTHTSFSSENATLAQEQNLQVQPSFGDPRPMQP